MRVCLTKILLLINMSIEIIAFSFNRFCNNFSLVKRCVFLMQFKFAYNFNESFVFQKILVKTNYI